MNAVQAVSNILAVAQHLATLSGELLASLKEMAALYDGVSDMVSADVLAKVERARAAIAKAEGRMS